MGAIYLLLYAASALWMTVLSWRLLSDWADGEAWHMPWSGIGQLLVMVVGAVVLHTLVLRRRGHGGLLQDAGTRPGAGLWIGLLMLVGSTVAAWLQFEWFLDPVHMVPLWTLAGGMLVAYGLASRLLGRRAWAQPVSMVAVALVGCPVGLLATIALTGHFHHHLSPVALHMLLPGLGTVSRPVQMTPTEPLREAGLPPLMGEQTQSVLQALSEAQTVDLAAEQAAGRLRREPDGSWVRLTPEGDAVPVGEVSDLARIMSEAQAADAQAAAKAGADAEAAWQQALQLRRDGGRLLGLQRP